MADSQDTNKKRKRKKREENADHAVTLSVEDSSDFFSHESEGEPQERTRRTQSAVKRKKSLSLEFKGFLPADTHSLSDHLSYEATTTDNKEVWLIRIPFDMDPSCLTNRKLVLGVKQDIAVEENGKRTSFEVTSQQVDKSSHGYCLLPSQSGGFLPAQLAGHLSVVKRVNVPHCSPVKKWAGNPAVLTSPSDLRQRWKPFGSGSPGLPSDLSTTPEKVGQRKLSFSPVKDSEPSSQPVAKRIRQRVKCR